MAECYYYVPRNNQIGGANTYAALLSRAFADEPDVDFFVCCADNGEYLRYLHAHKIPITKVSENKVTLILELFRLLNGGTGKVLITGSLVGLLFGKFLSVVMLQRFKHVHIVHGCTFAYGQHRIKRLCAFFLESFCSFVPGVYVNVSDYDQNLTKMLIGVKLGLCDTHVIRNCVENDGFYPHRIGYNIKKLFTVARLEKQKDFKSLLQAISKIHNVELEIFGQGVELEAIKKLTFDLGIEGRVHFRGFKSNLWNCVPQDGVFVLSSHYEGLPLALLEAGIRRFPIICTDVGGCKEVIKENCGFLVSRQSVDSIVYAIRAYQANPKLAEFHANNCAEVVSRIFNMTEFRKSILGVCFG